MCLCASIYTLVNYLCEKVAYCTHPVHLAEFHRLALAEFYRLAGHKLREGKGGGRGVRKGTQRKGRERKIWYVIPKQKTEKLKQQIGKLMGGGELRHCKVLYIGVIVPCMVSIHSSWFMLNVPWFDYTSSVFTSKTSTASQSIHCDISSTHVLLQLKYQCFLAMSSRARKHWYFSYIYSCICPMQD